MVKHPVDITLDSEVLRKVDDSAKSTGVSRSAYIEQVLRKHFKMGYVLRE